MILRMPGYLTFTRWDGTPDREVIEGYAAAREQAIREGEARAMRKLKQALTDAEIANLLEQIEKDARHV
jgi:cytochrome c553